MKIKIYSEEAPAEKVLRLRLVGHSNGVALHAVDESGSVVRGGRLLFFIGDGNLHLETDISEHLGLCLDERGRLEVAK